MLRVHWRAIGSPVLSLVLSRSHAAGLMNVMYRLTLNRVSMACDSAVLPYGTIPGRQSYHSCFLFPGSLNNALFYRVTARILHFPVHINTRLGSHNTRLWL